MNPHRIHSMLSNPELSLVEAVEALIQRAVDEALEAAADALEVRADQSTYSDEEGQFIEAAGIVRSHKGVAVEEAEG